MGKKLVRQKTLNFKACLLAKYRGNSGFRMIFIYNLENYYISFKEVIFKWKHVCVFFAVLGMERLSSRQMPLSWSVL